VTGNGAFVRAAAELPRLSLEDALAICLVLRDSEPEVSSARSSAGMRGCAGRRAARARVRRRFALAAPQAPDGPAALPALATVEEIAAPYDVPAPPRFLRAGGAPRRRPDLSQALPAARARTTASSTPSVHGSP
jgi:hypothetical protein